MLRTWLLIACLPTFFFTRELWSDQSSTKNSELSIQKKYENSSSKKPSPPLPKTSPPSSSKAGPVLEVKGGYFFFSDAKMRKIYDRGGLDLQLSGSYPLRRWVQIYGSVEYLERHGKSLEGDQKARIWEIPLSLG